jgi:hypothetical protein
MGLTLVRSGTFKNLTISAKPSRSPGPPHLTSLIAPPPGGRRPQPYARSGASARFVIAHIAEITADPLSNDKELS